MSTAVRSETTPTTAEGSEVAQSDLELVEAAVEAFTQTLPGGLDAEQAAAAAVRVARAAATQPQVVVRRAVDGLVEQGRIAAGTSEVKPEPKDRRFEDSAWVENPVYRRIGQSYLAWDRGVHAFVDDLDLDDKSRARAEFLATLLTDALAPTNTLLGNPSALREAWRTKGGSLVDGARHALHDLRANGGMPSMVDSRPFTPGENMAATPGSVVFSNAVMELIQYAPITERVHARPLVVVPPQVNRFYILDLAPGRSLIEHAVGSGHQVFLLSWRNPGPAQRDWNLETYVAAILEGIDAAREITGADDVNVLGVCAGGITTAAMLGHLAAIGDERVNAASFLVTVIDGDIPSTLNSLMSRPVVQTALRRTEAKGILAGDDLARVFAWLRPNDLVWNYVVNNYLHGKNPPAFDVLAWNGDVTNLPAGLFADFARIMVDNLLTEAGALEVLDTPVDLAQVTIPSFVVGAVTDHITPWEGCYETVNLLGGESEFVLSSQGHIQALVNPAGNPKGRYHTSTETPATPEEWLAGAEEHSGSWWDHWMTWLEPRSGDLVDAPETLGSDAHPAGVAAPGSYVFG